MKFIVEVQDYEAGRTDRDLTADRIESAVRDILDEDASDGVVIVGRLSDDSPLRAPGDE